MLYDEWLMSYRDLVGAIVNALCGRLQHTRHGLVFYMLAFYYIVEGHWLIALAVAAAGIVSWIGLVNWGVRHGYISADSQAVTGQRDD